MTVRFIIDNAHASAALAATSEALAIENTQNSLRSRVWRSANLATQVITGTITAEASGFAIARHNFSALATVQLVLKKSAAVVYDSGAVEVGQTVPAGTWRAGIDAYGGTYDARFETQIYSKWFAPTAFDEYEITITDATNPAGYMQFGQLFLGLSFEPAYGMSYGMQMQWLEQTEHQRTDGGSLRSEGTHAKHRRISFALDWLGDADRRTVLGDFLSVGKRGDVFLSAYPETGGMLEIEHAFVCKRMDDLRFGHPFAYNWASAFNFEET